MTEKYALFIYPKSFIFNIYYLYIKYLYGLANFACRSIIAKTKSPISKSEMMKNSCKIEYIRVPINGKTRVEKVDTKHS